MTRSRCRRRLERIERPNIIHHQALTGLQWMTSQSVLHTWHTVCAGYGCVRRREAPLKRNALVVADGQNDSYRCCGGRTIPIAPSQLYFVDVVRTLLGAQALPTMSETFLPLLYMSNNSYFIIIACAPYAG